MSGFAGHAEIKLGISLGLKAGRPEGPRGEPEPRSRSPTASLWVTVHTSGVSGHLTNKTGGRLKTSGSC